MLYSFLFETAGVAVQGSQLQNKRINAKNAQKQRTMKNWQNWACDMDVDVPCYVTGVGW